MKASDEYQPLYPPWRGLLDSSTSLRSSTATLPLVNALCFGFSVMQLFFHLQDGYASVELPASLHPETGEAERLVSSLSAARSTVVITLAASVAISAFDMAFALLEIYYVNMVEAAAKREHSEQRQQALLQEADAVLVDFTAMRALSRNGTWASLVMVMMALIGQAAEVGLNPVSIVVMLLLTASVVGVACTVVSFRRRYRPMLSKAGFVR